MRQEVKVDLQLTLDVTTDNSKEDIERKLTERLIHLREIGIRVMLVDIYEIREESEIYGTEDENKGLEEYNKKYHIDKKRQTKLDL